MLEAKQFASAVALNTGDGTFALQPLPVEAQLAPVYAALADDFDGDGRMDLLLGGNFYGVTPVRGRYDASYGLLLRGDGAGVRGGGPGGEQARDRGTGARHGDAPPGERGPADRGRAEQRPPPATAAAEASSRAGRDLEQANRRRPQMNAD